MLAPLRVRLQRRGQEGKRGLRLALPDRQGAQRVIGLGMTRLRLQNAAEKPLCRVDAPGFEMRQALANRLMAGTSVRVHRGLNFP